MVGQVKSGLKVGILLKGYVSVWSVCLMVVVTVGAGLFADALYIGYASFTKVTALALPQIKPQQTAAK